MKHRYYVWRLRQVCFVSNKLVALISELLMLVVVPLVNLDAPDSNSGPDFRLLGLIPVRVAGKLLRENRFLSLRQALQPLLTGSWCTFGRAQNGGADLPSWRTVLSLGAESDTSGWVGHLVVCRHKDLATFYRCLERCGPVNYHTLVRREGLITRLTIIHTAAFRVVNWRNFFVFWGLHFLNLIPNAIGAYGLWSIR